MTKALITGGSGFIGSHLVDELINQNYEVTVYDNLSTGYIENIQNHIGKGELRFVKGDLLDVGNINKAISDCDVVFHFGAHSDIREGSNNTLIDLINGTVATFNVLEAMRRNEKEQIIYSSSAAVYGDTQTISVSEDYGPIQPISLYGANKAAAEALISAYCHTFGFQSWIFRFANIVGKRRKKGVISDFIRKLKVNSEELEVLGDGTQCKPYLHVSECIAGVLYGYRNGKDKVNLFNIGVESVTDVNMIANIVIREMKLSNIKFKYTGGKEGWKGDVPRLKYNMNKINSLGWHAQLTSSEAILKAVREIIEENDLCRQ